MEEESKNENQKNKNIQKDKVKYPAAELLFSTILKEYDYENNRKSTLESRAGILLTLTAAISTLVVTNVKISSQLLVFQNTFQLMSYVANWICIILVGTSILVSSVFLLKVLMIDEYKRIDLQGFNKKNGEFSQDIVAQGLVEQYKEIIEHNQKRNNRKVKNFNIGIISVVVSVLLLIILFLLK